MNFFYSNQTSVLQISKRTVQDETLEDSETARMLVEREEISRTNQDLPAESIEIRTKFTETLAEKNSKIEDLTKNQEGNGRVYKVGAENYQLPSTRGLNSKTS